MCSISNDVTSSNIVTSSNNTNTFKTNTFDILDNSFFYYLNEINKIFIKNNFKSKIGSKYSPNSVNQIIIYYNPINITETFTFIIYNKYSITIARPITNSNFYFTTTFNDVEDVFNYIKIHNYKIKL